MGLMPTARALAKPPIVEALVDVRVSGNRAELDTHAKDAIKAALGEDYPLSEDQQRVEATFRVEARKVVAVSNQAGSLGLLVRSADRTRAGQYRTDGFTLNQLPPYRSADELIAEALKLWRVYIDVLEPRSVTRIALRYINKFSLPFQHKDDLERFLRAAPNIPDEAPQLISEYLGRVACIAPECQAIALVTQQLFAQRTPDGAPFVLDIDVFREEELAVDSETLLPVLQTLRGLKNRIFFSFLTDETLGLFE